MIVYKKKKRTVTEEAPVKYICDKCKAEYDLENVEHFIGVQEFHRFSGTGGYGSQFGDCYKWEVHLCDKCCYELFKPYIIYVGETTCWGEDITKSKFKKIKKYE